MDLIKDLVLVMLAYGYVFLTIFVPMFLKKRDKITKFQARKTVHLLAGLVVLIVPYFQWSYWAILIAVTVTALTYFSSKDSKVKSLKELYEAIGEDTEEKVGYLQGPFHYCLSVTLLISLFTIFAPDQFYFPISGILIMIISDTLASVIGKEYGKINIDLSYTNTVRTLEGSLTFFISAFGLCFFSFYFFGLINPLNQRGLTFQTILIYSLVTSALGTMIEIFSPSTWDDLTVPIATTLIIFLLTLL
ncbi:MAG: diacylglycerol/polyprenol kinase family protein [Promethearchaeia archaeon]